MKSIFGILLTVKEFFINGIHFTNSKEKKFYQFLNKNADFLNM